MAQPATTVNSLQPYPAYKPSGVEWLGDVPAHWGLPRLGELLCERMETNEGGQVREVLSLLRDRGVIPYDEKGNVGNKKSEDITRYKVVRPNDIVVNCMNVIIGSVGISSYTGCLSPVYYVLTRRSKHDHPQYLNAYFQTKPFQESLVRIGNGILAHRMRIPMELLKCEPFPHPPSEEQAAIARYLDHADRRIRRCIQSKEKLVELLEEQRQALIDQAVIGRVDFRTGQPYPAYKPSGVEWLGEVPAHWDVRRLKTLCSKSAIYGANVAAASYAEAGVRFIRTTDITEDGILRPAGVFLPREVILDHLLTDGDLLISRSGTIGRSFLYRAAVHGPCAYAGYLVRFVLGFGISPEYLFLFTKTPAFGAFLQSMTISSTIENVNASKYANCPVPIPPLAEQAAIARYLDHANRRMGRYIESAQRQIRLLNEYRTRLIADVVTGKLDVREAVSGLANDLGEPEGITGTDDSAVTRSERTRNLNAVTQASEV